MAEDITDPVLSIAIKKPLKKRILKLTAELQSSVSRKLQEYLANLIYNGELKTSEVKLRDILLEVYNKK